MRNGSSPEPTTVSLPAGRLISAKRFSTTSPEPSGATLPTMSMTEKYWFKKPISPGMTITPGMGGIVSPSGTILSNVRVNPLTVRFGIVVWAMVMVSGMMVETCLRVPSASCGVCTTGTVTSETLWGFAITTGKLMLISSPGLTAKAAEKLYAWKLSWSKTMPFSLISSAVSGLAVISVTRSLSITSMVTLSGVP